MCPMEKTNETPADSASATVQGTKITIGDLEYDAQQQTLRHSERIEFLTLCESKIIAYLSRNPGGRYRPKNCCASRSEARRGKGLPL